MNNSPNNLDLPTEAERANIRNEALTFLRSLLPVFDEKTLMNVVTNLEQSAFLARSGRQEYVKFIKASLTDMSARLTAPQQALPAHRLPQQQISPYNVTHNINNLTQPGVSNLAPQQPLPSSSAGSLKRPAAAQGKTAKKQSKAKRVKSESLPPPSMTSPSLQSSSAPVQSFAPTSRTSQMLQYKDVSAEDKLRVQTMLRDFWIAHPPDLVHALVERTRSSNLFPKEFASFHKLVELIKSQSQLIPSDKYVFSSGDFARIRPVVEGYMRKFNAALALDQASVSQNQPVVQRSASVSAAGGVSRSTPDQQPMSQPVPRAQSAAPTPAPKAQQKPPSQPRKQEKQSVMQELPIEGRSPPPQHVLRPAHLPKSLSDRPSAIGGKMPEMSPPPAAPISAAPTGIRSTAATVVPEPPKRDITPSLIAPAAPPLPSGSRLPSGSAAGLPSSDSDLSRFCEQNLDGAKPLRLGGNPHRYLGRQLMFIHANKSEKEALPLISNALTAAAPALMFKTDDSFWNGSLTKVIPMDPLEKFVFARFGR